MQFKNILFYILGVIIVLGVLFVVFSSGESDSDYPNPPPGYEIPTGAIHWHPWLRIIIDGQEQQIPDDVGISTGNKMDFDIGSDMNAAPLHTHSGSDEVRPGIGRKLHMESLRPIAKPRTLTLGYFFDVWGKNFNSTCIMDRCNSGGKTVKMFVNDKPNFDFQNYYMHDGDRILITYG